MVTPIRILLDLHGPCRGEIGASSGSGTIIDSFPRRLVIDDEIANCCLDLPEIGARKVVAPFGQVIIYGTWLGS
jgi:hypothetical protein